MTTDDTRRRNLRRRASTMLCGAGLCALFAAAPAAMAQTNSALLLEPFPKEQAVDAEASAVFLEGGHVAESEVDESFKLSIYNTRGKFRLAPGVLESPRVGYDFTYLDLDTDFDALPERLVDQSVAAGFPIGRYQDWILGASLGLGYAGDGGFGDGDAWYGLASLVAFRQLNDDEALAVVLDYDGNRTFLPDVPLPGFAYLRRIDRRLALTLGLPVSSVEWTPTERLRVQLDFLLPDNLRVDVGYEVVPHLTLFARAREQRVGFFLDGLPENYDRVIFEQRRAEVGLRYEPVRLRESGAVSLDLALGYAWHGEFSEGFDARDTNEIADVSDEPYVRAGVEVRF